jgi:hypothetical protein
MGPYGFEGSLMTIFMQSHKHAIIKSMYTMSSIFGCDQIFGNVGSIVFSISATAQLSVHTSRLQSQNNNETLSLSGAKDTHSQEIPSPTGSRKYNEEYTRSII